MCKKSHQYSGKRLTEAIYTEVSAKVEAAKVTGHLISTSGMLKNLGVSRSGYRSFLNRKVSHTRQRKEAVKIETINKAKACRNTDRPLIIHSDRGSQYVSNAWRIATEKMQRSYSHSGYPYDNACIESFHSLIKREWLNRFNIINFKHAYRLIFEYIETFYNTVRIHSHCDYMSPNDFEKLYERVMSLQAA